MASNLVTSGTEVFSLVPLPASNVITFDSQLLTLTKGAIQVAYVYNADTTFSTFTRTFLPPITETLSNGLVVVENNELKESTTERNTATVLGSLAPISVTATATTQTSSIAATPQASSLSQAPATSTAQPAASGLDSGAKIGLGVGVALGAILFLCLGAFLTWFTVRRRRRRQEQGIPQNMSDKNKRNSIPAEMEHDNAAASMRPIRELDGDHWKRELPGESARHSAQPAELN
ncbi:hypothetical protein MMC06_006606 [Schaereria dolodes]|nr:hypothetical protein [Schaereria dolodes]